MNELTQQADQALANLSFKDKVAFLGHRFLEMPQVECPLEHRFAPGVYLRQITMPAGSIIIGHIHRTEHHNVIVQGSCVIYHDDGTVEGLCAPMSFVSKAGVQKVLYILEDMIWLTIHPTDETDVEKLEAMLVEPPPADPIASLPAEIRRLLT